MRPEQLCDGGIFIISFEMGNPSCYLNNSTFDDFVDRVCPIDLEIKDTGYTVEACFIPSQTDRNCSLW
jgi:hypothetical protein